MANTTTSSSGKSRVAVLKLSSTLLARFPHAPTPEASSKSTPTSSSDTPTINLPDASTMATPAVVTPDESSAATPAAAANANGTSTPSSSLAPPPAGTKGRKPLPGPRGTKRGAANLTPDGLPKPRAKPGPKSKKQKLANMVNDPNNKGAFAIPPPIQKLGPKANQGAINAGLRALDRTGKPCRKWQKRGFQVRSFTGVNWTVPTWRAPKNAAVFGEDAKSESTTSSDAKAKDESSGLSDKSGLPPASGTPVPTPPVNGIASSPAPVAAPS